MFSHTDGWGLGSSVWWKLELNKKRKTYIQISSYCKEVLSHGQSLLGIFCADILGEGLRKREEGGVYKINGCRGFNVDSERG